MVGRFFTTSVIWEVQTKDLTLFNPVKVEKDEEAIEEKFEANRGCWFKLITSADTEVVTSYPEDVAQIINEGSYTKLQIFKIL